MKRTGVVAVATLWMIVLLSLTGCWLKRGPDSGVDDKQAAESAPAASPAPTKPELKVVRVTGAGAGQSFIFVVKLKWTGDKPTEWTIKRWALMKDTTGQTQSMLVIEDQKFPVEPGEDRIVQVRAIPIDPTKEAPRNIIVDYAGMPEYVLLDQTDDPKTKAVLAAIDKVDKAFADMIPLVKFVKDSIQYAPKDRDKVEPYLEIALWDMSGDKPRPFIEQPLIEAALVVSFANGMAVKDYAAYLQKRAAGLPVKDALKEAGRLQPKVNRLLEIAGLDARMKK